MYIPCVFFFNLVSVGVSDALPMASLYIVTFSLSLQPRYPKYEIHTLFSYAELQFYSLYDTQLCTKR